MSDITAKDNLTIFFTVVARNYLAHSLALADSVRKHHPEAQVSIFLTDDVDGTWRSVLESKGYSVIYPGEVALPDYRKFVFQYNVTEASTGVKPFVFQHLLDSGAEKVIYLDPDILCFRNLAEVFDSLSNHSIVLTPHICSPTDSEFGPDERSFLTAGSYNLGFIALRNDASARSFVSWWSEKLAQECLLEREAGLFVDQKWIDLVPSCFSGVFVLRDLAFNIAYWNLHERALEQRGGVLFEVNSGKPVAFIHFSGMPMDDTDAICKYVPRNPFDQRRLKSSFTLTNRPDLSEVFRIYRHLLLKAGIQEFSKIPYAYSCYNNGEAISQMERSIYLSSAKWQGSAIDPFATGDNTFWSACRKGGLRAISSSSQVVKGSLEEKKKHIGVIEWVLRQLIRILGQEKYLQFAKYMRHQLLPINHGFLIDERVFRVTGKHGGKREVASISGTTPAGQVDPQIPSKVFAKQ